MWRALAISLALHAWLLANGWPQIHPQQTAGALHATLRPLAAAPGAAPVEVTPEPTQNRPQLAATRVAERAHGAVSSAAILPTPAGAVTTIAFSTASPADRSPAEGGGGAARVPAATANAAAGQGGAGGDGADADGLRQYRLALAREARRFKRYPERALLAGIGGTAEVRVEHAAGAVPVARLARSSGDEALDAAALSMMREAAPHAAVPELLRGRSFAVSLPVIFDASAE
jgi:protein TonB